MALVWMKSLRTIRIRSLIEMGETSKKDAKTSTAGTGLGLWVVKETVERYNGVISVMDKKDGFGLRIAWKKPERRT